MLGDITLEVKKQYNRYPYPHFSWLAKVDPISSCHASFETGFSLVHQKLESHKDKTIGLLGCGTFEPYVFGSLHPESQITAVDLSPKSLRLAKWRCSLRGVTNVRFKEEDIIDFGNKNEGLFDYIHCYGVLHHLPEPLEGLRAIATALNETGFARIMVYSATQRRNTQLIRKGLAHLGINYKTFLGPIKANSILHALPLSHPLRLSQLSNSELKTFRGTVDSLLHSCEHPFILKDLVQSLKNAGLFIHAWDFSKTLLGLLEDAWGATLEEKITFLETFDQWPAPFTFWVSKKPGYQDPPKTFRTNPHIHFKDQRGFYSTLLKANLKFSEDQLEILEKGMTETVALSPKNAVLSHARFLLGVSDD